MNTQLTDTDRVDWMAEITERTQGLPAAQFRDDLDERILADRAAQSFASEPWVDLAVDFPLDDTPVRVRVSDGFSGRACFDSTVLEWYVCAPRDAIHGRLWREVFGKNSIITHWQPLPTQS